MRIDINTDVYPMTKGDKFRFALASTLRLDGKPDDGSFDQSGMVQSMHMHMQTTLVQPVPLTLVPLCHPRNQQPTVLDQDEYEYCMHGKVFQYKYEKNRKVSVLASFGGLLMLLQGEQRYFATVELDASIYCLIRRVADDRAAAETALQASKERRSKK